MRRLVVILVAVSEALVSVAVAGCGDQAHPRVVLTKERHPIWCPSRGIFPASGRTVREAGSFDVRSLLGDREAVARRVVAAHGCSLRVLDPAGHNVILTADARPDCVDVRIEHRDRHAGAGLLARPLAAKARQPGDLPGDLGQVGTRRVRQGGAGADPAT